MCPKTLSSFRRVSVSFLFVSLLPLLFFGTGFGRILSCESSRDCMEDEYCDFHAEGKPGYCMETRYRSPYRGISPGSQANGGQTSNGNTSSNTNNSSNNGSSTNNTGTNSNTNGSSANNSNTNNSGTSSGNTGQDIQPLPKSTFVFSKEVGDVVHLYAYDIDTKQLRLISDLDNAVESTSFAISPDRKWIAFTGKFRLTEVERLQKYQFGAVWVVSADGRQYHRITPVLNALDGNESQYSSYSPYLTSVRWSHDGKRIWFIQRELWKWYTGKYDSASSVNYVTLADGKLHHFSQASCRRVYAIEPHPMDSKLAVSMKGGCSMVEGVYIFDLDNPGKAPVRVRDPQNRVTPMGAFFQDNMYWQGFYLVLQAEAQWGSNSGGTSLERGYVGFDMITGSGRIKQIMRKGNFRNLNMRFDGLLSVMELGGGSHLDIWFLDERAGGGGKSFTLNLGTTCRKPRF